MKSGYNNPSKYKRWKLFWATLMQTKTCLGKRNLRATCPKGKLKSSLFQALRSALISYFSDVINWGAKDQKKCKVALQWKVWDTTANSKRTSGYKYSVRENDLKLSREVPNFFSSFQSGFGNILYILHNNQVSQ